MSGINYATPTEDIRDQLGAISKQLLDGLGQFRKSSPSSEEKLKKTLTTGKQVKILKFTQRLHLFLDLDAMQAWNLLQLYLLNEYKGSATNLSSYISTESAMLKLLTDIWASYTLERMVMLRVLKTMLEYRDSPEHPYAAEYRSLLNKIGIRNILRSYIDQFEGLLKGTATKMIPGDLFNSPAKLLAVSERNLREEIVILQVNTR